MRKPARKKQRTRYGQAQGTRRRLPGAAVTNLGWSQPVYIVGRHRYVAGPGDPSDNRSMPTKSVTTVEEYLDGLSDDRREAISRVRAVVKKHLPKGYSEFVGSGMLSYGIPLKTYPKTYNGQPLCYAALAAQKNYCSLYLMSVYGDRAQEARLRDGFKAAGKKLDMGKSCIRFRSHDDLPLDVVGDLIASVTPERWIQIYEDSRKRTARG